MITITDVRSYNYFTDIYPKNLVLYDWYTADRVILGQCIVLIPSNGWKLHIALFKKNNTDNNNNNKKQKQDCIT